MTEAVAAASGLSANLQEQYYNYVQENTPGKVRGPMQEGFTRVIGARNHDGHIMRIPTILQSVICLSRAKMNVITHSNVPAITCQINRPAKDVKHVINFCVLRWTGLNSRACT